MKCFWSIYYPCFFKCLSRSWVWNLWDRLGQSHLLNNLQVLHCGNLHLLLLPASLHDVILLRVHYQHCQNQPCLSSSRSGRPHWQAEENGKGRHPGRCPWLQQDRALVLKSQFLQASRWILAQEVARYDFELSITGYWQPVCFSSTKIF